MVVGQSKIKFRCCWSEALWSSSLFLIIRSLSRLWVRCTVGVARRESVLVNQAGRGIFRDSLQRNNGQGRQRQTRRGRQGKLTKASTFGLVPVPRPSFPPPICPIILSLLPVLPSPSCPLYPLPPTQMKEGRFRLNVDSPLETRTINVNARPSAAPGAVSRQMISFSTWACASWRQARRRLPSPCLRRKELSTRCQLIFWPLLPTFLDGLGTQPKKKLLLQ